MRRYLFAFAFGLVTLSLCADTGFAQGFRQGGFHRPAPTVHSSVHNAFVAPFNNGLTASFNGGVITSPRMQANSSAGTFNPSTGAFVPGLAGPVTLSHRAGFEPVNGTFTPSLQGDFVLSSTSNPHSRERGNFTPSSGSFVNSATGSLNPFTGAFVPGGAGNVTLASNGAFVPSRGVFVPSPNGNFVVATKEAFNPLTGAFVPSRNGTFIAQVQGNFIPTGSGAFTTSPFGNSPNGALNAALVTSSLSSFGLGNPYGTYNPYWTSAYNPYGFATSYYNPYANPYLNTAVNPYTPAFIPPAYSYANYSAGYAAPYVAPVNYAPARNNANSSIPAYTPNNGQARQQPALTAYGIPNEDGAVRWPLAFRLLSPEKKRELLDPLEGELRVAATQAVNGNPNPNILRQAKENLDTLYRWLHSHRLDLAEGSYRDADNFLRQIDGALKTMRAAN
jgi:hypothetical protein